MPESTTDASLRGRIAAYEKWARTADRTAATAPARAGLDARFAAEVDPDGTLEPGDRARRVQAKRKAYFARLARMSAHARRSERDRRAEGEAGADVRRREGADRESGVGAETELEGPGARAGGA